MHSFLIWEFYALKHHLGHQARRSGWLGINFDHLGIFNVRRNLDTPLLWFFASPEKRQPRPVSNPRQRDALATEPPRQEVKLPIKIRLNGLLEATYFSHEVELRNGEVRS